MKKKKLSLGELKVTSFVTEAGNVKGGETNGCGQTFDYCDTLPVNQCNVPSYNANCPTLPVQDCNVNPYTMSIPGGTACLILTRDCTAVIGTTLPC
jgi:hypothetical protein